MNSKIAEAKQQVRQVEKIHGLQPATGTACATYIGSDRILTYLDDPSGDDGKHMDIDNKKFFDAYYAPFLLAGKYLDRNSKREKIDGLDVEFYDLVEGGRKLSIGLDREILELIKSNRYSFSGDTLARLKSYSFLGDRDGRYSVGLDGFVVSYTDH
ncbi:hypothetical protein ACIQAL_26395 [Pseudomonas sp. NPDC088368]|uniref:hypothetical protein n=1 Tax=Pseudomonas sp. NPDC088368 TaxID=3364453 RepID=UPI00380792E8